MIAIVRIVPVHPEWKTTPALSVIVCGIAPCIHQFAMDENHLTVRVSSTKECHTLFLRKGLQVDRAISVPFLLHVQFYGSGVGEKPHLHGHNLGLQRRSAFSQQVDSLAPLASTSTLPGISPRGRLLCRSSSRLLRVRGEELKRNYKTYFVTGDIFDLKNIGRLP